MSQVYTALVFPLILLIGQAIVALGQRKLTQQMDERQAKTDEERRRRSEWRDGITKRLDDMEDKLNRSVSQQTVQIRSDIVHKCHRYLDDLGRASSEEKETLNDAFKQYREFCKDLDIENDFIDMLVDRVMKLPEREI